MPDEAAGFIKARLNFASFVQGDILYRYEGESWMKRVLTAETGEMNNEKGCVQGELLSARYFDGRRRDAKRRGCAGLATTQLACTLSSLAR